MYDIDVVSDRAESPQSRRCDHFKRRENKHRGVIRDCRSLASVSCLLGRRPSLSIVGDDDTSLSQDGQQE